MCTTLEIKEKNEKLYVPEKATIKKVVSFTDKEMFFELELASGKFLGHVPGQFVQVSVLGIGEAPISISSPPSSDNKFELCVRAVGNVTKKLHTLKEGDAVFIRGPFGHGFDEEIQKNMQGKHLVFVAGGLGYAPLRSLINKVLEEKDNYKKISILYGSRSPKERLYQEELAKIAKMGGNVELLETVDHQTEGWQGDHGVITTLIPKVDMVPEETIAVIVGPPIMYKFVLISLMEKDIPKENIYMSLERRMKCGVGKCGHCQMDGIYVCQEGPVFKYSDVETKEEVL
jgi:sulfite reductase subunit B